MHHSQTLAVQFRLQHCTHLQNNFPPCWTVVLLCMCAWCFECWRVLVVVAAEQSVASAVVGQVGGLHARQPRVCRLALHALLSVCRGCCALLLRCKRFAATVQRGSIFLTHAIPAHTYADLFTPQSPESAFLSQVLPAAGCTGAAVQHDGHPSRGAEARRHPRWRSVAVVA